MCDHIIVCMLYTSKIPRSCKSSVDLCLKTKTKTTTQHAIKVSMFKVLQLDTEEELVSKHGTSRPQKPQGLLGTGRGGGMGAKGVWR